MYFDVLSLNLETLFAVKFSLRRYKPLTSEREMSKNFLTHKHMYFHVLSLNLNSIFGLKSSL